MYFTPKRGDGEGAFYFKIFDTLLHYFSLEKSTENVIEWISKFVFVLWCQWQDQ